MKIKNFLIVVIFTISAMVFPCGAAAAPSDDTVGFVAPEQAFIPSGFEVSADIALLVNDATDQVIYSKNPNKKAYPASLTKLMTALLTVEHYPDLDGTIITVTSAQIKSLSGTGSSMSGLKGDEQISVRHLLYLLLMTSGNDSAVVLAENIGGSLEEFSDMMNERAEELGMKGTHYTNPHGLQDFDHYTTAADMYKLTKYVLTKLPVIGDICNTVRFKLPATNKNPERTLSTTNFFIDKNTNVYYKNAKGVKTGHTEDAGRCLITTCERNGFSYYCIVMNSPPKNAAGVDQRLEFADCKNLFNWVLNDFTYKTIISESEPMATVKVELCSDNKDEINLIPSHEVSLFFLKDVDVKSIVLQPVYQPESVEAPIKKGDVLGKMNVMYGGEILATVDLVAGESANRSTLLAAVKMTKTVVKSPWFLMAAAVIAAVIIGLAVAVMLSGKKGGRPRYR